MSPGMSHLSPQVPAALDHQHRQGNPFSHLIRLSNQTGTLLLLLPSLWALVLASQGSPDPILFTVFILGAFFMRSAGVVMNDLADRSIDQRVHRTRQRPLASGALSPRQGILVALVFLTLAASLLVFLNPLAASLSPIALLLAAMYPFSKRIIHIPQFMLGLAFGWGAVMAWAAVRNEFETPMWLLFAATVFWALAYDTIYALQDREDDRLIGVRSSAIFFGPYTWLGVGIACAMMLACLGVAGWVVGLGSMFYGVLAATGGFLTQQIFRLRSHPSPTESFSMFKQHVWVGLTILLSIWLGFL